MSTTATKRPWSKANDDGKALRDLFPAACYSTWSSAGSVRRKRPEVSDVDHVIIPIIGEVPGEGLFGETKNLLWHRLDELLEAGQVDKAIYGTSGFRWGDLHRGVQFRGFKHELRVATPHNFGPKLAIFTGPADFSTMLVNLLRDHGMRNKDGFVWRCEPCPRRDREGFCMPAEGVKCSECDGTGLVCVEMIPCGSEEAYFQLCGIKYLSPEARL